MKLANLQLSSRCQSIIDVAPLQVYASALVFCPARSITRGLFRQEEGKWITTGPIIEDNWNACRQTLEGHGASVNSAAFSPDSKLVATGSDDDTIKIWDAATGSCRQTLEGHGNWVRSVAFSPDSRLVASGSLDETIKIWDAATGTCRQTLEGHHSSVKSVASSLNSSLIASGSDDTKSLHSQSYAIGSDRKWITKGSENWLWLPLEYRPACWAAAASMIAIGCPSGRVLIVTLATGKLC
jgi:WD40 repeat protein